MPTVTLTLKSQRDKLVSDHVDYFAGRGKWSGQVQPNDIALKPPEIVLDLVPDTYTLDIEVGGFRPARRTIRVGQQAAALDVPLENHVTRLPKVSELDAEQRRLLQTLDSTRTPAQIWSLLPDNKSATFFQVSFALAQVTTADGRALSSLIDRVVIVGGAQLTAPDTSGVMRTVVGWRMHVAFVGDTDVEGVLTSAGLTRDQGPAHPTHARFGFVRSYRERRGQPRLQVVTDYAGRAADVDLDAGAFHRSSPQDVFKSLAKRFPGVEEIYLVGKTAAARRAGRRAPRR